MPLPKSVTDGTAPKKRMKSLRAIQIVRSGRFFWQTDTKIPAKMQSALGFEEIEDGVFEVERPRASELPEFGRSIEEFGFKVKLTEQQQVVAAPTLKASEKSEGEEKLDIYLEKKQEAADAKTASEGARDELKEWMVEHTPPTNPAHENARVAQIGEHKVHNSWVNGRETKWDDRDHTIVSDWAIEQEHADELVSVVVHRTISFEEYEKDGIPEGYDGTVAIDHETYKYYVSLGAVPQEIHDAFEARGKGYYGVKVYETKDLSCTSCGAEVKKTQKFCGECGTKQER